MPEGPEVKKIGEALAKVVSGKTLIAAEIISGRFIKKQPSGWTDLTPAFPLRIVGAGVHGKFCYWLCDNEIFIYSTFGMTGNWSQVESKHKRIKFTFSDGSKVFYNDQRNFGTIKIVLGKHNLIKKLKGLGPDILSEDISDQDFIQQIRKKPTWGITKVVMDQSIIAGIGNYIKADSLWLARINPHKTVSELSDGELALLNRSIKSVIRESYNSGSTIAAYPGYTKPATRRFLVYGQDLDPDGKPVIKEETADGRSTYYVEEVQK